MDVEVNHQKLEVGLKNLSERKLELLLIENEVTKYEK
jgi:hypothetical protein